MEAFRKSYNEQVATWGFLSLEEAVREKEAEALERVYQLTGERLEPILDDLFRTNAREMARHFEEGVPFSDELAEREKRLSELQAFTPELPTYRSIWDGVKEDAQTAAREQANLDRRPGGAGRFFGRLAGGAIGSIDPRTDPLNVAMLPIGIGRSVAGRIAGEIGIGGGTELVNQLTGVQEQRKLLGLDYGLGLAAQQVAFAGIGAGIGRGLIEGGAAGIRRLRSTPTQRAAGIHNANRQFAQQNSPYGKSPLAVRTFADEFELRVRAAEAWTPEEANASIGDLMSSTALPRVDSAVVNRGARLPASRRGTDVSELDGLVRARDPALGRLIDDADGRIAKAEQSISSLESIDTEVKLREEAESRIKELEETIADQERQIADPKTDRRKVKKLERKLAEARAERESIKVDEKAPEPAKHKKEMAHLRKTLKEAKSDREALRHRYDRVLRKVMAAEKPKNISRETVDFLNDMRGKHIPLRPKDVDLKFPELVQEKLDLAEEVVEASVEAFQNQRPKPVGAEDGIINTADKDFIEIGGQRVARSTEIEVEEGKTMTLDDILKDMDEDDALLQAANACKVTL